jgi:hypothetical protein
MKNRKQEPNGTITKKYETKSLPPVEFYYGDGLMDILLVERDRLRIYPSQGEKGFGKPPCERKNDVPTGKTKNI